MVTSLLGRELGRASPFSHPSLFGNSLKVGGVPGVAGGGGSAQSGNTLRSRGRGSLEGGNCA